MKCVELGISLRPPSMEHRRVKLPLDIWTALRDTAHEHGETIPRFCVLILSAVIRRGLSRILLEHNDAPAAEPAPALASLQPRLHASVSLPNPMFVRMHQH